MKPCCLHSTLDSHFENIVATRSALKNSLDLLPNVYWRMPIVCTLEQGWLIKYDTFSFPTFHWMGHKNVLRRYYFLQPAPAIKVHEKIDYMNLCTHETVLTSLHSIYLIKTSSWVTDKPNIETNDSISHIRAKQRQHSTKVMALIFYPS